MPFKPRALVEDSCTAAPVPFFDPAEPVTEAVPEADVPVADVPVADVPEADEVSAARILLTLVAISSKTLAYAAASLA